MRTVVWPAGSVTTESYAAADWVDKGAYTATN